MSKLILRPHGQQHAEPQEIVGFSKGMFYTRSGGKLLLIPAEKLHRVG